MCAGRDGWLLRRTYGGGGDRGEVWGWGGRVSRLPVGVWIMLFMLFMLFVLFRLLGRRYGEVGKGCLEIGRDRDQKERGVGEGNEREGLEKGERERRGD